MTRKMIVNAIDPEEIRIAILNQGILEDFDIESRGVEKNKGNIYKAVVAAVEPSLNAAFIDYGVDKQGFLTANDVDPRLYTNEVEEKSFRINELLKPKQNILVQVTKDEVNQKGAVLTTYLSLAGRYAVLMPGSERHGISRKIEDDETRRRMREAAAMLDVPDNMGVIVRTAGKDRSREELNRDLQILLRLWGNIKLEVEKASAPALIFKEQDVVIRALRDYYRDDIDEIVLDNDEAFDRADEYMHLVMPDKKSVLSRYVERRPIFHHYRIEEQLEALYASKVTLPSGGSLVIESTEALVSIDVNSGKQKLGAQEETAFQTNIEAAREIARQIRLRDLGGIIVIDFIDMNSRRHEQRVERVIKTTLADDKARIKVGRISPNGTLELTRQRIRSALEVNIFRPCDVCHGTGHILKPEAHAVAILRKLRDRAARGDLKTAKVNIEPTAANVIRTDKWAALQEIEQNYNVSIDIVVEHSYQPGQEDFTFETDPNVTPIPIEEPNFGPAPRFIDDDEDGYADNEDNEDDIDEELDDYEIWCEASREEQMVYTHSNNRGHRRDAHNRNRDRSSGRLTTSRNSKAASDLLVGADLTTGLPSFELIDPSELGFGPEGQRNSHYSRRQNSRDEDRHRRGRRGGKRRHRPYEDGTETKTSRTYRNARSSNIKKSNNVRGATNKVATATTPKKKSLLSRLAFWRKD
ncbi:MAG: Rne/Rng family ribonuclease [Deltaproteobacteria bacterium]|nr:Rne/Rng family ribonuclease [Deltaproteobacteria bacterium]